MSTPKLLVPLDGSELSRKILSHVRSLCSPDAYDIILLRVAEPQRGTIPTFRKTEVPNPEFNVPLTVPPEPPPEYTVYPAQAEESVRLKLIGEMRQDTKQLEEAGFNVTQEVRFGDPASEILTFAEQQAVEFVAMATHGRTGLGRLLMGSVTEKVLRHLAVPILLVHPIDVASREPEE